MMPAKKVAVSHANCHWGRNYLVIKLMRCKNKYLYGKKASIGDVHF